MASPRTASLFPSSARANGPTEAAGGLEPVLPQPSSTERSMRNYGFLIATCIALPSLAIAQDKAVESSAAYAHFKQAFSQICFLDSDTAAREYYPSESWELSWQYDYSDQTETAILYKFFCGSGAYNVNHVYYLDAEFDGPHPLGFATPHFDVVYENDDFD